MFDCQANMAAIGFRVSQSVRIILRTSTGQACIRRPESPIACASASTSSAAF